MRTEEAIGCNFRGDQAIIPGACRAAPADGFLPFRGTEDYEENENGEPLDAARL